MARRATVVNPEDRFHVMAGEPILDTTEGVLIIAFDDGTSRTFNWDKVIDFYHMTEDEYETFREELN
ncbi:hypothetical protein TRIXIE_46 [Mycobacterium phage Trixie]|uniref:Uncharacterized protein n=1 Tax=Mycobacterium phage Trixie TaxID=1071503 RepID=G1JV96_9CAUD|nr:hypothetical protein TRIXIE_46 [Mycobacterium phage Trixie]AEL17913.1 hypothetical protein TRIXIE_46 [Mycobacterium phage Trixie]